MCSRYFKNHRLFRAINIDDKALDKIGRIFSVESMVSDLAPTESNAVQLYKKAFSTNIATQIGLLREGYVVVDLLETDDFVKLGTNHKMYHKVYNPDLLRFGKPVRTNGSILIPEHSFRYDESLPISAEHVVTGGSWYAVEIGTSRGSLVHTLREKARKKYDYLVLIAWGSQLAVEDIGIEPIVMEDCIIYSTMPIEEPIRVRINNSAREWKIPLEHYNFETELELSREDVAARMYDASPNFFDDDEYPRVPPKVTNKEFFEGIEVAIENTPELEEFDMKKVKFKQNNSGKETYHHGPFPINAPLWECDRVWQLLRATEIGNLIDPGQNWDTKKLPVKGGMGATLAATKGIKSMQDAVYCGQMHHSTEDSIAYLVTEVPKDNFIGRGIKLKECLKPNIKDFEFPEMKKSNNGNSLMLRWMACSANEELEYSTRKLVLEKTHRHFQQDHPALVEAKFIEEKLSKNVMCTQAHLCEKTAQWVLGASGKFKERKKDKTVKCMVIPYAVKNSNGTWYVGGYVRVPNAHVKNDQQKYFISTVCYLSDNDVFVGMSNWTIFQCANPQLRAAGIGSIGWLSYPISRIKLMCLINSARSGVMAGMDWADKQLLEKYRDGREYKAQDFWPDITCRIAYNFLCHVNTSNQLEGTSKAGTKVLQTVEAKKRGKISYNYGEEYYEDFWKHDDGLPGELQDIITEELVRTHGAVENNLFTNKWTYHKAAALTAALSGNRASIMYNKNTKYFDKEFVTLKGNLLVHKHEHPTTMYDFFDEDDFEDDLAMQASEDEDYDDNEEEDVDNVNME